MKRFLLVSLILMFLVSMLIPIGSAFAYDGGLLNGVTFNIGTSPKNVLSTSNAMTDNDTKTFASIPAKQYAWYTFSNEYDLTSFRLHSNANGSFTILYFYDAYDNLLGSINHDSVKYSFDGSSAQSINFMNVKKVAIQFTYTSSTLPIYEFDVFGTPSNSIVHDELSNLNYTKTYNTVDLSWSIPSGNNAFTGSKIYRDGSLLTTVGNKVSNYTDSTASPSTTYNYKVTANYSDGFESTGLSTTVITDAEPVDTSLIPPSNVTGLTVSDITSDSAKLTWVNPSDPDLSKINIYKDGSILTQLGILSEYVITGLSPESTYNFSVSAVDVDLNESGKVPVTFTTLKAIDTTPPSIITGLTISEGSENLYISWKKGLEPDISGYNLYVDGVKVNSSLIKNDFYSLSGLTNGKEYQIEVSAVDTSGNESILSISAFGTPFIGGMPILGLDYSLSDVAYSVENWFSEFWLIIAFASSIPLAFYIGARLKLMFLE